jgi:hypothetical protein
MPNTTLALLDTAIEPATVVAGELGAIRHA